MADVDLSLEEERVVISLEFAGGAAICPECGAACPLRDHAPERQWRHLETMQFETVLKARVPRANCPEHGVRNMDAPWSDPHSRFTLKFEAFAIDVLIAASSIRAAAGLLRLGWDSTHSIMRRAGERGLANEAWRFTMGMASAIWASTRRALDGGKDYISVMTDPDGSRAPKVVPGGTEDAAARRGIRRRHSSGSRSRRSPSTWGRPSRTACGSTPRRPTSCTTGSTSRST